MLNLLKNDKGSSLVVALVCVAVVGAVAATAMQLSSNMSAQARSAAETVSLSTMVQAVETVAGANSACLGGGVAGLKFKNAGGAYAPGNFLPVAAADPTNGQDISVGTQLLDGATKFDVKAGAIFTPLNLTIDQLIFRKAVQLPGVFQYSGEMVMKAHIGSHSFAPRVIGQLTITTDGGSNLLACTYAESAQIACEAMNCKFNPTSPGQKCVCGFPAMSCPATAPGEPRNYIASVDLSSDPPHANCGSFKVDCTDPAHGGKGPGFFLAGFDTNGDPLCQPVEGNVAASSPPPTPTATPPSSGVWYDTGEVAGGRAFCGSNTAASSCSPIGDLCWKTTAMSGFSVAWIGMTCLDPSTTVLDPGCAGHEWAIQSSGLCGSGLVQCRSPSGSIDTCYQPKASGQSVVVAGDPSCFGTGPFPLPSATTDRCQSGSATCFAPAQWHCD